MGDGDRTYRVGDIQYFQALSVAHEEVLKLHGKIHRILHKGPAILTRKFGMQGIVYIHHLNSAIGGHIEIMSRDKGLGCAVQFSIRVKNGVLVQEIILRVAVEKAGRVDDDEADQKSVV